MEKLVYVLWGEAAEGSDRYRDAVMGVAPELVDLSVGPVWIDVDDAESVCPSPAPPPAGEDPHVAVVSLWVHAYDRRPQAIEAALGTLGLRLAGYRVAESLWTDYGDTRWAGPRDWAAGERSPGISTVALLHRPEGLAVREWRRRWHGTQSPVSAEIQPRTRYVRNEVAHPVTDDAPELHGIVEECWASIDDVTDPMRFFCADGDPELLRRNVERMMESVGACLDLARLRSSTMSEYLLS